MARRKERVKQADQVTEYTPTEVLEISRCIKSFPYFAKKYVKIQHPTRGAIPFVLYDYQQEIITKFETHRYNIILSSRQTGKCLTPNTSVVIIKPHCIKLINKVKKIVLWLIDRKLYNEIHKNL
jgi:hypothetical protein